MGRPQSFEGQLCGWDGTKRARVSMGGAGRQRPRRGVELCCAAFRQGSLSLMRLAMSRVFGKVSSD